MGGQMHDDIDPVDRLLHVCGIADVTDEDLSTQPRNILAVPDRQVVEHTGADASRGERTQEVDADEPAPARDEPACSGAACVHLKKIAAPAVSRCPATGAGSAARAID